jgi:CHASE2 domain-containing sensor protein
MMSTLVVINLGSGSLQNGCPNVVAQISQAVRDRHPMKCVGSLPPAPELEQLYKQWQLLYREFYRERGSSSIRAISIEMGGITHFSEIEFSDLSHQLKLQINSWLNSESFHPIDRKLSRELASADEIQVIIETDDDLLRRLPWHLWNFFEDYPKAEMALSVQEYGRVKLQSQTPVGLVRILAILGNKDDIDIQTDRQLLEELPGVSPLFLEQPSRWELDEHLWDPQGWDILFFAGHSQTDEDDGRIYINQTESLTLNQLRNALKKAISRGLKLAIFNSCDGLGLAQSLADLHIPQVIVMRELVPDRVAQEFFRHFLAAFSAGQSLYTSVREARERLEKLEDQHPCATWLPVICQNPAAELATWKLLQGFVLDDRSQQTRKHYLQMALLASMVVTASVLGIRQLDILQESELQAFDQLVRLRPAEKPDPRLLLVTVTEKDVQNQNPQDRRGSSISDHSLSQLLKKLESHRPRVIGFDVYRDFPVDQEHPDLLHRLQHNEQFVAVCEVGTETNAHPGTRPIPGLPDYRLSFSDFPIDSGGFVRRQLLGMSPNPESFCVTDVSFSLRIAQLYLDAQGIYAHRNEAGELEIGDVVFKRLDAQSGGYQQLDTMGYQILLNYRASNPIAQTITLTELLQGKLDNKLPDLVRDRIVLIGTTAPSFKDYFLTPYSKGHQSEEMPGVIIHAHMVSQILSAVLDQRPLLWWFPSWAAMLWVGGWSLVGGAVALLFRSPLRLGLAAGIVLSSLYVICFVLLLQGGWVPLVPAVLAFTATGGSVAVYIALRHRKLQ